MEGGRLTEDHIRDMLGERWLPRQATAGNGSCPGGRREFVFDLRDFRRVDEARTPAICGALADEEGVVKLEWRQ